MRHTLTRRPFHVWLRDFLFGVPDVLDRKALERLNHELEVRRRDEAEAGVSVKYANEVRDRVRLGTRPARQLVDVLNLRRRMG